MSWQKNWDLALLAWGWASITVGLSQRPRARSWWWCAIGHLPWYRAQSYYQGAHGLWKGTWDLDGGGSLMNQGVHTVDLIQWLAGGVASVMGMFGVFGHDIEAEDQTVALFKFKNGAIGTGKTSVLSMLRKFQELSISESIARGGTNEREHRPFLRGYSDGLFRASIPALSRIRSPRHPR